LLLLLLLQSVDVLQGNSTISIADAGACCCGNCQQLLVGSTAVHVLDDTAAAASTGLLLLVPHIVRICCWLQDCMHALLSLAGRLACKQPQC
jgi:hypothetical protein